MKNMIKKLNTARSMLSKDLINIVTRLAKIRIRRYAIKFHPVKFSNKDFLKATGYKTIDDFLNRNQLRFFFNSRDKEKIVGIVRKEYSESIKQTNLFSVQLACN